VGQRGVYLGGGKLNRLRLPLCRGGKDFDQSFA
jgi:hypothetical protein